MDEHERTFDLSIGVLVVVQIWTKLPSQLTRYITKNFSSHYKVSYRSVCKCCGHATSNKKKKIESVLKWKQRSTFDQSSLKLSNKVMDYLYI